MNVPSRFVSSGDLRLAVYESGRADGPTVVLVHGYPDNAAVFDGVAAALGGRFRVVRYDVRGAGLSEAPRYRGGYRVPHLVDDLAAVVGAVGGAPVHLVAHDWGSVQGWQAVTEPDLAELFATFTTMSGPCLDHVARWTRSAPWRAALNQLVRSWYIGAFQVPVLPELVMGSVPVLRMLRARRRDAVNGLGLYRANMLGGSRTGGSRDGGSQDGGSQGGGSRDGGERRTAVPVQQLVLARDRYVSTALVKAADPWCTRLYRRTLDAGHWAPRSQPDRVAVMVTEFIDYLAGSARPIDLERAA